ncbi:hypothetical protein [Spiroplasma monobiae]|uniref:Uncharacterized protein n=1 Tax=Spiroplasma monobiae MQ-1 TaxID=1336748 RepID=A0A2K9LYF6_SPISQ|nr:hypothetical protein [Spiroplasma monobiae]AUM62784.1 hypothetical protein SMONO_v1c05350 [Spiroplasma monobiae MQ-1]
MEKHFNKIAGKNGFYDFEDKLNYFDYFDIKGEDLENAFLLFKKYENNMHELKVNIEQRIKERYEFYITHSYKKEKKEFVKVKNDGERKIVKSLFTSLVFLGARLVSQEYVLLSTINKLIYNVDLRVFKFFNEKFNYNIYKKSLKEYYETLTTFGLSYLDTDIDTFNIFQRMDEYIEKDLYSLKAYKDIFLFMWMYTYIKYSCDLSDYAFKINDSKRSYPKINSNVLVPMNYDRFFDEEGFEEENEKRKTIVNDFRGWSLEPYYITIENQVRDYYKQLMLVGNVNLNDYFVVADEIKKIYLNKPYYSVVELEQTLFTEASAASQKLYTMEEIEFIIKYVTFDKKSEEYRNYKLDNFYDLIYKKPILEFRDSNGNPILLAFPEFIWMAYHMQREYHFFDKKLSKTFNVMLRKDYNPTINEQLKKIEKRFGVMKAIDPKTLPFFIDEKNNGVNSSLVDCILYDKALNRLFFVLTNFYSAENIDWINAKRTIDTYGLNSRIVSMMFSRTFNTVAKDLKKLKKQIKKLGIELNGDESEIKIEGILFINDILNAIPVMKVDKYPVHIVSVSTMEYFTTSYIYKK